MKLLPTLFLATGLLLAGCGSAPVSPEWEIEAEGAARRATQAYLSGNTRVQAQEWERARMQVARTGRPDLMARLELLDCAAQVASLQLAGPCAGFEALREDAAPPERAYADYLAGQPTAVDLLLEPQRAVAGASGPADAALAAIQDPLSRLVAAGALVQARRASAFTVQTAVDTASQQGWRRALMAWLLVQLRQAEQAGDAAKVQQLQRRLALTERSTR